MTSLLTIAQGTTPATAKASAEAQAPAAAKTAAEQTQAANVNQASTVAKTAGDQAQATQQVPSKAPQEPQKPSFMDGLSGMLPFIIIIAAMFFLMWRGQSKERKRREEMMNSIVAGTKVLTLGGIYGIVDSINGDVFKIKIADNVKIEINRNGIASVIKEEKAAEPAAEEKK